MVSALILLAAGGVGYLAYNTSSRMVDRFGSALADKIATVASLRTVRNFETGPPFMDMTIQEATAGRVSVDQLDPTVGEEPELPEDLLHFFRSALIAYPEFSWLSFSTPRGTYVAVRRLDEGLIGLHRFIREDGATQMRVVDLETPSLGERSPWTITSNSVGDFDPRKRPYYQEGTVVGEEGVWIEPYIFSTAPVAGVAYARPQYRDGVLQGLWAIEYYEFTQITDYLAELQVVDQGRVYVVTWSGKVVTHPEGQTVLGDWSELAVADVTTHPDLMLQTAWEQVVSRNPGERQRVETGDYLVIAEPFPPETGMHWTAVVVVPEETFFGPIRAQAVTTAVLALLAALVAAALGAAFASRVSSLLSSIRRELDLIGRFEIDEDQNPQKQSLVREVNEMAGATARMKQSLRSFGKYVPRELVRDLILRGEEAELGGRKTDVTVLFTDIVGFTSIAERTEPAELVRVLGVYLDAMSGVIREHGGTVDKFIGDAIMAFWGAPRERSDHATRACRAALAMEQRLDELSKDWEKRGFPRLDTRFGINTGEVIVGNIGAPNRMNYTVVGDTVNLASRLEGLNRRYGTTILIGESTARAIGDRFVVRPIKWVAVKGKDQATLIYELVGHPDEISDEKRKGLATYAEGLDHYRAKRFSEAARSFEASNEMLGGDGASERLLGLSRDYAKDPPDNSWNGVVLLTTKE